MRAAFPTVEERLCVLLTYYAPSVTEAAQARALARRVRTWDALWTLADTNAVAPQVHGSLHALGLADALPPAVHALFARRAARVRAENTARLAIARPVLAALVEGGIPVAVLKGAFLAEAVHRDPGYKRMNDLDLLMAPRDLDAAYAIYAAAGLRRLAGGGALGRPMRLTHHGPLHVSPDLRCVIDTQWGLVTPLRGYRLDYEALWSRTRRFDLQGVALLSLAPEDHLHHLCVHLGRLKTAVGDLADLYNLLRRYRADLAWEAFLTDVERAGSADAVYHALALAHRLCPMLELEEIVRELRPRAGRYGRRLVARKSARVGVLLRVATDHLELVQRDFAAVSAAQTGVERWAAFRRLWRDVLWPPRDVAVRLGVRVACGRAGVGRARLLAPWRILRALAAEVGALWVVRFAAASAVAALARRGGRAPALPRATEA